MARNGSGTYVLPAGQPVVTNTTISSTNFNTLTADLATALTQSICTDGQTPMAANLSMGSHKINNVTDGTLATDAATKSQVDAVTTAYVAADVDVRAASVGRNLILNSKMEVAQRSATYALTTTVALGSLDRWYAVMATSAAGVFNQNSAPAQSGFNYFGKLGRNNGSSLTNAITMAQALETARSIQCAGKTVVLSFTAYAGANFSSTGLLLGYKLTSGTGIDQATTSLVAGTWTGTSNLINSTTAMTTTPTRYSASVVVPATVTQLGVQFSYTPSGTAGADDAFYITGIQLEVVPTGQTAPTTYEFLSFTSELTECLRFYQRINFTAIGYSSAGGTIIAGQTLPVRMRVIPSVSQVSNNYSLIGANTTLTTSTYIFTDNFSCYAYRVVNLTAAVQFSELAALSAEL